MKTKYLKKNIGEVFRVFPQPVSRTWTRWPEPIAEEFNRWRLERVEEKQQQLVFHHAMGYRLEVGFDHIIGRTSPDIFELRSQVVIRDPRVYLVPLRFDRTVTPQVEVGRRPPCTGDEADKLKGVLIVGGLVLGLMWLASQR